MPSVMMAPHKVDSRFADSPMLMRRLDFKPRARVAIQVFFSLVLVVALWSTYWTAGRALEAVPWSGLKGNNPIPGWVAVLFPILAIIPGIYAFLFLKYNFNK
jgi:hypothetical protein